MAENRTGASGVRWDDSRAKRAYANECSVSTSREEFVVSFGVKQASQAERDEVLIEVAQRVVMSPYVAKRLAVLLDRVVREHESRFGGSPRASTRAGKEGDSVGTV